MPIIECYLKKAPPLRQFPSLLYFLLRLLLPLQHSPELILKKPARYLDM
jgi:hypothetical protein